MDNQEIFDIYDKLFAQEGWKELVQDFKERRETLKESLIANHKATEKELYMAQGMNSIFNYIINLEKTMEEAKKQEVENAVN